MAELMLILWSETDSAPRPDLFAFARYGAGKGRFDQPVWGYRLPWGQRDRVQIGPVAVLGPDLVGKSQHVLWRLSSSAFWHRDGVSLNLGEGGLGPARVANSANLLEQRTRAVP